VVSSPTDREAVGGGSNVSINHSERRRPGGFATGQVESIHHLTDRELARRLTENARRLIEERYTWETAVETLESAYQLAVARIHPPSDVP